MSARDVIFAGAVLFMLGIGFFVLNFTQNKMFDALAPAYNSTSENSANVMRDTQSALNSRMDYLYFGVFIALIMGIIITGWFVGGHSLFMFFYFLFIVMAVFVSMIFSNTWEDLSTMSAFGTTLSHLPIMNHILLYLPLYLTIIGVIGLIVMFAKPTGER